MKAKTKRTTGTESEKWTSHGGISVVRGKGGIGGNDTRKNHNWQAYNRQGEVKHGVGNKELKELICTTHGHELRWGGILQGWGAGQRRNKGGQIGKTGIA